MSTRTRRGAAATLRSRAAVFAALGDETRLALVGKLVVEEPRSISQLAEGSKLTRQAITKHLRVLESVGIVQGVRAGRENLFELKPEPFGELREYLERVSLHWDHALSRLRSYVERDS